MRNAIEKELRGKKPYDQVTMWFLSKEFGWTPGQIRNMQSDDIEKYLLIEGIKARVEKFLARKQQSKYGRN